MRKTDDIVYNYFEEDELFTTAHKDGFDYVINLSENRATELLAAHSDRVLRLADKVRYHHRIRAKTFLI